MTAPHTMACASGQIFICRVFGACRQHYPLPYPRRKVGSLAHQQLVLRLLDRLSGVNLTFDIDEGDY
jgi:hypothetical protein